MVIEFPDSAEASSLGDLQRRATDISSRRGDEDETNEAGHRFRVCVRYRCGYDRWCVCRDSSELRRRDETPEGGGFAPRLGRYDVNLDRQDRGMSTQG
jgi:hypothetical protein